MGNLELVIKTHNSLSTGKQANSRKSKMPLSNILLSTNIITSKNTLKDSYAKVKNANREVFLPIKECLVYNIVWSDKPNLYIIRTKS